MDFFHIYDDNKLNSDINDNPNQKETNLLQVRRWFYSNWITDTQENKFIATEKNIRTTKREVHLFCVRNNHLDLFPQVWGVAQRWAPFYTQTSSTCFWNPPPEKLFACNPISFLLIFLAMQWLCQVFLCFYWFVMLKQKHVKDIGKVQSLLTPNYNYKHFSLLPKYGLP